MIEITPIGKEMLLKQKNLSIDYHYDLLSPDVAFEAMAEYLKNLPKKFWEKMTFNPTGATVAGQNIEISTLCGTPLANKYERIVVGHYGAFIEIADEDINKLFIKVKKGQEYRINDPAYKDKVKYHWYTANDDSDCKLYYQLKTVKYADYKPGYWYISPYEVI